MRANLVYCTRYSVYSATTRGVGRCICQQEAAWLQAHLTVPKPRRVAAPCFYAHEPFELCNTGPGANRIAAHGLQTIHFAMVALGVTTHWTGLYTDSYNLSVTQPYQCWQGSECRW